MRSYEEGRQRNILQEALRQREAVKPSVCRSAEKTLEIGESRTSCGGLRTCASQAGNPETGTDVRHSDSNGPFFVRLSEHANGA